MSVADNFVFQFSTKGDKDVSAALKDLLNVMRELKEEIVSVSKVNKQRQQELKTKEKEEREKTNLAFRERRFQRAEERKDHTARVREKGIEIRESKRAEMYEYKSQKEMWRMKDAAFKHEVAQRKEVQRQADRDAKIAEKEHKKKLAQEREEHKLLTSKITLIRNLATGLLTISTLAGAFGIKGAETAVGYSLLGGVTGTSPTDIKKFSYASKYFGGTEASAKKQWETLNTRLQRIKMGQENPNEILGELGRAGINIDREALDNVDSFMQAVSESMQKIDPKKLKTVFAAISGTFDDPTKLLLRAGYSSQMERAGGLILVRPEQEEALKQFYDDLKSLSSLFSEIKQLIGVGMSEYDPETMKNLIQDIKEMEPFFKSLGNLIAWVSEKLFGVFKFLSKVGFLIGENIAETEQNNEARLDASKSIDKWKEDYAESIRKFQANRLPSLPTITNTNTTNTTDNRNFSRTITINGVEQQNIAGVVNAASNGDNTSLGSPMVGSY